LAKCWINSTASSGRVRWLGSTERFRLAPLVLAFAFFFPLGSLLGTEKIAR
jgi:hypothetical protein